MPEHNSTAGLLVSCKVLVAGAARGLRLAFARSIAKAGGAIAPADILDERVQEEAAALRAAGFDTHGFTLDLDDPTSIQACAAATAQTLGRLDGLINNVAITNSDGRDVSSIDIETQDHVMNVDVRGTRLMATAYLPALKASDRGATVNLSSDTPLWGAPDLLAYMASKNAVIDMTKSLVRECGADSITVNAIAPSLTLVRATEYMPAHHHALYRDQRVISRDQLPDDVCGAVLFALPDLSQFVTGQTLAVSGGFIVQ